jgi:hypothetical protein
VTAAPDGPGAVVFEGVAVESRALRLGDRELPLRRSPRDAGATVTWHGLEYTLRPWTFGERRRLLAANVAADGELDVAALSDAALEALVRPVPGDQADREVVGLAALAWSATGGARTPAPLPGVDPATQVVTLAAATGWRPADIDGALAADVDHWYAAVPSRPAVGSARPGERPDGGFTTLRPEA